jgi:hypothetical protein
LPGSLRTSLLDVDFTGPPCLRGCAGGGAVAERVSLGSQDGADLVADLGRPVLQLNFEEVNLNRFIRVFRGVDCVTHNESYFHPHIGTSGEICYGSASPVIAKELADFNILGAIKYVRSLLLTYNPESPYRQLAVINNFDRVHLSQFYKDLLGGNL